MPDQSAKTIGQAPKPPFNEQGARIIALEHAVELGKSMGGSPPEHVVQAAQKFVDFLRGEADTEESK